MTTDRPTATRAPAPPQRSPLSAAADRPAADAFSALLGAATPRTDDAPRARRDDVAPRADQPKGEPPAEEPKAEAPTAEPVATEEPAPTAPRNVTPDLFALQLASPLPTTPATPAPAVPQPASIVPAQAEVAPAIPTFPSLNLLAGPTPALPAGDALPGEAATPAGAQGTPGGIPLPFLAGLTPASQTEAAPVEIPVTPPTEVPAEAVDAPQFAATATAPNAGEQSDTPHQQPNPQAGAVSQAKTAEAPAPAAPTPTPVAQAAPVAQPVATPAATALQRAVPLYRAPETAAHLIQIAAERGITHAKLNLKPVELGGIEVRLQTTPQGVTAQLVADSAEAAKLLTQAADDLRRSLADREVNLLSLDVSTQQQYQEQQAGAKQADIFGSQLPGGTRSLRFGPHGDAGLAEAAAPADTTLVLPNGVLVDVLA
jgi:hypothetical protein